MTRPFVPWAVAWEGEMDYDVRPCEFAGDRPALWQPAAPGVGRPLFERLQIVRSRQAIWEDRCPICGECTDEDDRWWFPSLGRGDIQREDGTTWAWATLNAGYHRACGHSAMDACPHLSHTGHQLMPMPRPDAIFAAHLKQVGPSMQGFTLLPGQIVVSNLFFVWQAKPKGAL